ncbi:hypothetical protein [Legionella feeleii]|uniref:Uncharacterized protein n=1 Tax=Legionella feeleii TaxID=453 RepID=A0A0W0TZ03_9GAMM|nr:hypothetical protein [Legionella feeleii]KTD00631.1 hypothetical protein Lfee_1239 [Legionella feeleii]SPX61970.1 Uncharacterised protein [Legionella feeleii]
MNTYTEVIDGHKCKFDISEYKGQYHGLVDIEDPCIIDSRIIEKTLHPTEGDVLEKLRGAVRRFTQTPSYAHPLDRNGKMQEVGTICFRCNRKITTDDMGIGSFE